MSLANIIILIILIVLILLPAFRRLRLNRQRLFLIRSIEERRGSRVISIVHRPELMGLRALFGRGIDLDDSERVIEAVRATPADKPIDIVLHTPGGMVLATEQIVWALKAHPATVTAFVPFYAMSGGSLIALAADELVMDENAVLGPIDPTVGYIYSAASVIRAAESKHPSLLDDQTLILLDSAYRARDQVRSLVHEILKDKYAGKATRLTLALTEGRWTHDFALTPARLRALGFEVAPGVPDAVFSLAAVTLPTSSIPPVEFTPGTYGRTLPSGYLCRFSKRRLRNK